MELFPAADEEQWKFIKKVIDDCDYYLLIIGGRYGFTDDTGISYTEKEFDYAVESGLKVIALIHGSPDDIPFGKSEQDSELREKLLDFKDKVMTGRLVKFWNKAEELAGLVAFSLTKTIKTYPAIGWVRANNIASESILAEINDLSLVPTCRRGNPKAARLRRISYPSKLRETHPMRRSRHKNPRLASSR